MKLYIYIILFGGGHWSGMTLNVYVYSICSGLRVYDDIKERVMLWKIWDVEVLRYCRELQKCMILILWYWMELWLRSWIWWMRYIGIWWALHDTAIYVPSRDDNCRLANRQLFVLRILFGLIGSGFIGRLIERSDLRLFGIEEPNRPYGCLALKSPTVPVL